MKAVFLALTMLFIAGCTTQPIKNVDDHAVFNANNSMTQDSLGKHIHRAASQLGWSIKQSNAGHMVAEIKPRGKHFVAIDIYYDNDSYSIHYKKSSNMKYDAEKNVIHRNYNNWVANLVKRIDQSTFNES
ncbi:hypothetical protein [Aliamphritea spongicola]|uniref:hypothetical protein n=1 Tax=Aliamphritea spongicola TaxID=707589 RepID=UPI00196ABB11|nr:hypothetical protein [Aliamphritea spongicola]MBN3564219.1 hypothetical protein [Aliamphritea spongicola]